MYFSHYFRLSHADKKFHSISCNSIKFLFLSQKNKTKGRNTRRDRGGEGGGNEKAKSKNPQIKDAIRDGLRAINNAIVDKCLIPRAGAFEIRAYNELLKYKDEVRGKVRFGIQAFAEALLVIPKNLIINAGYDPQDVIVKLLAEDKDNSDAIGIDLSSGKAVKPVDIGVYDNYLVKRQIINFRNDFQEVCTCQNNWGMR